MTDLHGHTALVTEARAALVLRSYECWRMPGRGRHQLCERRSGCTGQDIAEPAPASAAIRRSQHNAARASGHQCGVAM